jgi:DNA-binding winged helix-turn-helix (wHTH) protein/TolB-like protein/tetratricopeptide (TPR) repeat protein
VSDDKIQLFEGFTLDLTRGCVLRGGEPVHLRPQAYGVLKLLVEKRGRLISKDELIEEVWRGRAVTDGSLSKCIEEVREALGDDDKSYIRNVPRRGYIFDPGAGERDSGEALQTRSGQVEVIHVVVEEQEETGDAIVPAQTASTRAVTAARPGFGRVTARKKMIIRAAACLLILGLAAGIAYYIIRPNSFGPTTAAGIRSLAVLPFRPLLPEGRDEVLEMGMADTLITRLGGLGVVPVRPISSVRRYAGLEQDAAQAGEELGVEAVLDGSIQRAGERVRVTARLVRVSDGRQLWSGQFDEKFTDIFAVQDAICERVAGELALNLRGEKRERLSKNYTKNAEAYQLYLRGRYHVLKLTQSENQKGVSYIRRAIEIDPSYALAYFGLAHAYSSLALSGELPSTEWFPKAKAETQKALEIDDQLAEAHASLGFIHFWYDRDWGAAEKQFKRALELNPTSAETHMGYAHLLSNTGRHAEALAEIKRARELDPLNLLINALEGQFLTHAGQADEALATLQKTFELDPNFWFAHMIASSAYTEKGMYAEAVAEARTAKEFFGGSSHPVSYLGYALAKSGRQDEARAELEGLLRLSKERYLSPYNIALVYNGLGETDEAIAWLGRGVEQRDPKMTFLKVEPKWNNLRSDPRFQDLLRRVGLTP